MPKPGIHPMMHMVRVVLTNGASVMMPMAWQRPYPGLQITTKFLEVDYLTHENYTGVPSKSSKRVGRRARFENRFGDKGDAVGKGK